jgi:tetratricopeptide (TPR) repeat protein
VADFDRLRSVVNGFFSRVLRRVNKGASADKVRTNLRFSTKHPRLMLSGLANACMLLLEREELATAREVADEIRGIIESGPKGHAATVRALHYAAQTYELCGELDLAVPLREQMVVLERARHGVASSLALSAAEWLASDLRKSGDTARAIELLQGVVDSWRTKDGDVSTRMVRAQQSLGIALYAQGDFTEAQNLLAHVVEAGGRSDPTTDVARGWLAASMAKQGDMEGALTVRHETMVWADNLFGPEDRRTLHDVEQFAATLWAMHEGPRARILMEGALAARERVYGDEDGETKEAKRRLSALLEELQ